MSAPAINAADVAARLETLARVLHSLGRTARLVHPPGRQPFVFVRNDADPEGIVLREHVIASPDDNGTWLYWRSWAEPIAADAAEAAATIVRCSAGSRHGVRPGPGAGDE